MSLISRCLDYDLIELACDSGDDIDMDYMDSFNSELKRTPHDQIKEKLEAHWKAANKKYISYKEWRSGMVNIIIPEVIHELKDRPKKAVVSFFIEHDASHFDKQISEVLRCDYYSWDRLPSLNLFQIRFLYDEILEIPIWDGNVLEIAKKFGYKSKRLHTTHIQQFYDHKKIDSFIPGLLDYIRVNHREHFTKAEKILKDISSQ